MSALSTTFRESALSADHYEHTLAICASLAKSSMLPPHFQGKPENVLLVYALAQQLDVNPVMALWKVSIINGKPCLQSDFMISLLNQQKCLKGPLKFEWGGNAGQPNRYCVAYGVDAQTEETIKSEPISLAMAQAEGWTRNPKYKSLPDTMLKWRAAAFFVRTYYPQVVLGLYTAEEVEDVEASGHTMGERSSDAQAKMRQIREERAAAAATPQESAPKERDVTPTEAVKPAEPETTALEEDPVFFDFLQSISDMTTAEELTTAVEQCADFDQEAQQQQAKRAVYKQSKKLGAVWKEEGEKGQFVFTI